MTKTHTIRSRLISLVLVLVMVLGCLPMSALAADPALESTFVPVGGDQTFGDFHVRASVTDGYKLQTVGLETTEQKVGMTLRLYHANASEISGDNLRIKLYDGDGNCIHLIDVNVTTDSYGNYTKATVDASYENGNSSTPDSAVWKPTTRINGQELLIEGIRVTLTGSGNFPLSASITGSGANTTEQIQLLGSFDIKGYSVDVPTVNLTFNLDATDAYYAYSTVTIEKDQAYTLPTVTPIRENYTFKGWKDADGTDVTGSISADKTGSDLMLTAVWEQNVVTSRTVTYSAGDSVTDANYIPSTATVVEGSEYTIPAVIPTRPGYTFVQWIDAGNTVHQPGDTITVNGDVTLTAEWTENTVTITWPTLPTGVTGSTGWNENTTTEGEGATVTFKLNLTAGYDPSTLLVTANGAALVGVNETGTTVYEYSFVASSDTTIAVSAPSKLAYTVLLPSGNFTAAFTAPTEYENQTSAVVEYGGGYTFTVKPNKGYKILAIYVNGVKDTSAAAADGTYTVGVTNVTSAQNIRVDAEEVQTYAVTFVVPQLGQTLVQYVDEGGQATKPVVDPILVGYDFAGWYTGEEYNKDNGTAYVFDTEVTGDLVLYGKLTAKTYTVSYNGNGNGDVEGIKSPQDKKHGEALTLYTQVPTRTGYTFLGWSTTADGAVVYQPGEVYSTDADITLYAVWQKNTYTVTLPSGAGYTVTPAGMGTVEHGDTFTFTVVVDRAYAATEPTVTATNSQSQPVTVSRTGDKSDTSAVTYTYTISNVTDNLAVSITVAKNSTYTVTYYQALDDVKTMEVINVQMVEHGYYTTAPVAPELAGYTFKGWFNARTGGTAINFAQPIIQNTDIYAVYEKKSYTVTDPAAGDGWSYEAGTAVTSPVKHGEDFSFTVTVKEGYDATNMVVGVNGFVLAPDSVEASGKDTVYSYTIRNITEAKAISVTGVVRKTVTIVYNNNGGIGGPTTQVVKYYLANDNDKISTIKPTRDGYTFLGWAKAGTDGSIPTAPAYSNPATADPATKNIADFTEDTVLYAVWQAKATAVTLTVAPADQQYEGSEVSLTATVPTGGTGSVLFYRSTDDANNTADDDTLVGNSNVSGDKATATVVVKDYDADAATDYFYAVFKPTDGAGYQESTSAVVPVTVKSTAITWGVAEGVVQSELKITEGTPDAEGNMIAGQTYTLTIPDVYALDDADNAVTNYTVTWEKKSADGDWAQIANADDDSYIVTAYNEGDQYRAKLTPTDPYNKAVNNPAKVSYTATLVTGETEEAVKQATEIALTVTDTHDIPGVDPDPDTLAEFEGQDVTLTASVTYGQDAAVTEGYVQFYLNGVEIGQPVAVNAESGKAVLTWTTSKYDKDSTNTDAYTAKYLGTATYDESKTADATAVTIRSTAISWKLDNNSIAKGANQLTIKETVGTNTTTVEEMVAGHTYTLELPDVYALDNMTDKVSEYTVTWQKKDAQQDWVTVADAGDTYTVTSYKVGDEYRAVVTPADPYTKAQAYNTDGTLADGYVKTLIAGTGVTVKLQPTATTLEVSDTHDYTTGDDGTNVVAEFEGQDVTLTASVTYGQDAAVTEGYVQFYLNDEAIGEPVAVNAESGKAVLTWCTSEYEKDVDSYTAKYLGTATYDESKTADATAVTIRSTAIAWGKLDHDTEDMALTITDLNTNTVLGEDDILVAGHTYQLDLPEVYERDRESIGALTVNEDYRVDWYQFNADATQGELIASLVNLDTVMVKPETDGVGYYAIVTPVDGSNYTKAWTIVKGNWAYNNFLITGTEERSGATPTEIALTIDGAVAMNNSWEQYEGRTITLNAKVNVKGNTTTMVEHGNVSFYVITESGKSTLIGGQPVAVENGMASVAYELPEYLLKEGLENIEYFYAVYEDVSTELSGEVRYQSSNTIGVDMKTWDLDTADVLAENQLQVRSIAITWELTDDKTAIADGANAITIYNYDAATGGKGAALGEDEVMDADKSYVLEMPAVYAYDAVTGPTEHLAIGTDYTVQWQYYVKDTESWMNYNGKDAYSASIVVTPEYHDYGFRVQVTPKYDNDSLTGFRKAAKYTDGAVTALDFQVLYSDTTVPTDRKDTDTDLAITGADWELQNVRVDGDNNTFTADHHAQFEGQTVTLKATVTEADAPDVMIPTGYVYFYRYEVSGRTVLLNATPVEVKDGIAELEVTITNYDAEKTVTANADKFFAVYEPNDTYDGSASTNTNAEGVYEQPAETDWVYIKSTTIKTPIVESALPGKINDAEAYATTYTDDLEQLKAGVEHTFTLRQDDEMTEADYSVVALDGRYVEKSNYTIQWLVKNGDNEETTAAENVNPYVTTTTKTGDMYRLWLEPKGDMTVGEYSEHLIVGTKQLVNVTVVASDEIEATEETDVYQLNDITLTATVVGAEEGNSMKPTGKVTFYYSVDEGATWVKIDEAALAEDAVTGDMVATLVTNVLPVDAINYTKEDVTVTAIYEGDETFLVSATFDEDTKAITDTEGSETVDDDVTVYSSVVLRSSKENEAQTYTSATPVEDGLMAWVDGSLLENEENVTLNLTSIYTLDGEDDAIVSLLEHNTDYTIAWQEITNYSAWKGNITSADTPWTTLDNSNTHSYSVSVKQGAAYRAVITVKDAAAVQGSWNEVLQAAAEDATTGSKVYYSNILVAQPGQATVTYNVTTSNQTDGYEGIVEGEAVTIHTYVNGATETTPISEIKVTITNEAGEKVFSDVRYNVNGYSSSFKPWTTTAPGYYEMTITATSSNGYEPSTIQDTLIVRDDNYTLTCTKDTFVYDGLVQGIEWTLSGMDIEDTMAQNSVVVYYYDADDNLVEPTQAGTYSYKLILPESAYWTEKFIEGELTVEQRLVKVADLVPQTKVYDGTTNVNLLEIVLNDAETDAVTGLPNEDTGIINGDSIYATGTGYITAPNAGRETLRVKDLVLNGDDAHNYKLPENTGYSEKIEVLRNQLKGDIANATYAYTGSDITLPAEDVYLINQQGDVTDYVVTYYYHNGEGVEKVDAMNAKGMYTVVVGKDDNYKGGASQTVYVADTAVDAEPVKNAVSTLISITDTAQLYGESDGVKVALTNASATYELFYNVGGNWVKDEPKDAGRYLVKVTTSTGDTAYGLYTITKANPVLTLTAAGITYDSAPYDGALSGTYNGDTFPEGTYYTYAGGNILGVAYEAPTEAGDYVITAHVPETPNYTAHEVKANFTIAKAPLTIKADQLQRFLYSAYPDAVCTYTGLATGGVAPDTSLRDIQIQPELNYTGHTSNDSADDTNHTESLVGWFQVEPVNALAKNYEVTYEVGEFSVTELDPQPELAIHGAPQNGLDDGTIVAYYGDAIQLYAYGNQMMNGTINKSSVLKWSVTGPATIDEKTGLLEITGVGTVTVKLTRGEGTLAISTSITIDARKQEVKVQLADQDKVYNGQTQTYGGTVNVVDAKYATVTADVDLDKLSRRPVGSQIVTGVVDADEAHYQSETYGGLFTINDEEAVILPKAVTAIYGTKATMNGYTEQSPVGSDSVVISDGDVASIADAYGNLDVGKYEILVAGREDMNYNVSYKTRPVVTVNELDMDVQLGSYANVDTERDHDVGMTGIFDDTRDFPANGSVVTPPLTFEVNGLRMFGEPNQVMGFQTDALIPGDSEADLAEMLAWLVEFQMNDHVYINADANITYPSHDGTPVKITGRDYDYDIESTMDYTNYDVTVIKGTQNIYQRPVTLSLADGVTKPNAYFDITLDDLIEALEKVLVVGKYNGEGGLADLLNHTIKDLDLQFQFTTEDGKTWDGSESYVGTLHVKVTVGNLNYWLANPFEFDVELLPYKYVVEYNSFTATSATVTLYKVDKDGNREAAYLPDGVDLVGQIFTKLPDGATYDDYVASGVYKEYTMVKNSYVTGRYTVTYPRLTGNYRFYATVKDVGYNIISQ